MSDKALPEGVTEGKTCKPRTSPEGVQEQRPGATTRRLPCSWGSGPRVRRDTGNVQGLKIRLAGGKKAQELHSLLAWKS